MDPKSAAVVKPLTLEQFERLPEEDEFRVELVRGRLVREPGPGLRHGRIVVRLARILDRYAEETGTGFVVAEAGFLLAEEPPTVRLPDVAFLAGTPPQEDPDAFSSRAPDLAIEVLSPSNSAAEILEKVADYLRSGSRLVWVLDPKAESVTIYRPRGDVRVVEVGGLLEGEDVLPGFRVEVTDLFEVAGGVADG